MYIRSIYLQDISRAGKIFELKLSSEFTHLFTGPFQEMDSRFIVIAEELVSRVHYVELIGDEGVLHHVQGGDHGITRRGCRDPGPDAIRRQ